MDQIEHKYVLVNGLNLHVADIGSATSSPAPVVVFLHCFPEIWYSWRHQMIAVANAGFRAIAPDYRGYGLSDPPPQPDKATYSDLLAILDTLQISKVFLIGKDFGVRPLQLFALLHPKRVTGIITLGVPIRSLSPLPFATSLPKGCYINRWREPGRAEADFDRFDAKTVVRNVYILFSRSELPIASENQEIMALVDPSTPLPSWFTEDDLAAYGALYTKSGFQTALKVPYRPALNLEMDPIEHKYIDVNGLKLHVAESGIGESVVIFLHGFPEIWYSWRHQMIALAKAGYRAIAPDYRGYGLSDPPPVPENATISDLLDDLLGIIDALNISKVFLVGKDFGARPAYIFALLHPERVKGVITLGIPHTPLNDPPTFRKFLPEGFYINRWEEPAGRAEADFGRFDAKTVVRNVYILFSKSELPIAGENEEIMDLVKASTPLPCWFTEEDLAAYGALYENSGFRTALKVPYRSLNEIFDIEDPKVNVPSLLIMGEKDYFLKFPGMEDYVRSGQVKYFVPDLEIVYIPEGTHFVQEQFPEQVNQLLINFLGNHS